MNPTSTLRTSIVVPVYPGEDTLRCRGGYRVCQLGKRHSQLLIEAGKPLDLVLSAVMRDAAAIRRKRKILRKLRKSMKRVSNRDQEKTRPLYFRSIGYRGSRVQRPDISNKNSPSKVIARYYL